MICDPFDAEWTELERGSTNPERLHQRRQVREYAVAKRTPGFIRSIVDLLACDKHLREHGQHAFKVSVADRGLEISVQGMHDDFCQTGFSSHPFSFIGSDGVRLDMDPAARRGGLSKRLVEAGGTLLACHAPK